MNGYRKIIHIDMDAFYASVELRDNPCLRGMPVCVGGDPKGRGVVTTCSYEARKFGIHSAMPARQAIKLCPQAIFVRPRFDVYQEASEQIKKIFYEYTDLVQPMSLDEAYLDITTLCSDFINAKLITQEILTKIYERTRLPASAGVSFNKFLAKVGSDFNKPNGITLITPEDADEFIDKLPIGKFFGAGKVTKRKMIDLRIFNGADLKKFGLENLLKHFGKAGEYFYSCALGIDDRPIRTHGNRKSLGHERTLHSDIDDKSEMITILSGLADKIEEQLKNKGIKGKTITLKVRYYNFQRISRSITLNDPIYDAKIIMRNIKKLLNTTDAGVKKVRLLGISITNLIKYEGDSRYEQLVLKV